MGTIIRMAVDAPGDEVGRAAVEAAWRALADVERLLHPDRAGSDLVALHAAPTGTWVPVHPLTRWALGRARRWHRWSGGVFDPCLPGWPGTLADLQVSEVGARACVPLRLDLGGHAKGCAVDLAVARLRRARCVAGIVDAGGDLRVFGARTEAVRLGRHGGRAVMLARAALAVSEPWGEAPPGHVGWYCRVPGVVQQAPAAAVLARTAGDADALAKCALYLPVDEAAALCARHGAQLLPCGWLQPPE